MTEYVDVTASYVSDRARDLARFQASRIQAEVLGASPASLAALDRVIESAAQLAAHTRVNGFRVEERAS